MLSHSTAHQASALHPAPACRSVSQVLPYDPVFSPDLSLQTCPLIWLYLCCFLLAQQTPGCAFPQPCFRIFSVPVPISPGSLPRRYLIGTRASPTSFQTSFQMVLPHQQPPPCPLRLPAPLCPVVVRTRFSPFCPGLLLPALCRLSSQSRSRTSMGRDTRVSVWLLPKDLGSLPAGLAWPVPCSVWLSDWSLGQSRPPACFFPESSFTGNPSSVA